jgi:hypothetical protein
MEQSLRKVTLDLRNQNIIASDIRKLNTSVVRFGSIWVVNALDFEIKLGDWLNYKSPMCI